MDFMGDYAEFRRGRPKGSKDKKPRRSFGIKPAIAGAGIGAGIGLALTGVIKSDPALQRKIAAATSGFKRKGFQGKPATWGKRLNRVARANIGKTATGAYAAAGLGLGYGAYRIVKHGNYKLAKQKRLSP